jgi:ribosomal protein S8
MRHFCSLISQINSSVVHRKSETLILNTKFNRRIISILFKEGFLLNYIILDKNIKIFFKYVHNLNSIHSIFLISTPGRYISWSYLHLRKLNSTSSSTCYILTNSKLGICSSRVALLNNQGGIILCKIQ